MSNAYEMPCLRHVGPLSGHFTQKEPLSLLASRLLGLACQWLSNVLTSPKQTFGFPEPHRKGCTQPPSFSATPAVVKQI